MASYYYLTRTGEVEHIHAMSISKESADRYAFDKMRAISDRQWETKITSTQWGDTIFLVDDGYEIKNITVVNNVTSETVLTVYGNETPKDYNIIAECCERVVGFSTFNSVTKGDATYPARTGCILIFSGDSSSNSYDVNIKFEVGKKTLVPDGVTFILTNCTGDYNQTDVGYNIILTPNDGYEFQSTSKPTCYDTNNTNYSEMIINSDGTCSCVTTSISAFKVTGDAIKVISKVFCHFDFSNLDGTLDDYDYSFDDKHTSESGVERINKFLGDTGSGDSKIGYFGSDAKKRIDENNPPYVTFTDGSGTLQTLVFDNNLMNEGYYYHFFTSTDKKLKVCSDVVLYVPLVGTVTNYFITQNLINCTSDCNLDSIDKNSSITIVITPNTEFHFDNTPTATMGDEIIESSQLETGYSFTFNNVDGDIVINATAVADVPSEQNNADYGFINIYNPSLGELQNIASKYFINFTTGNTTTLTEYIIGMFQIFAKPLTLTSRQSVKFGKYDTGVGAKVVREPKVEVDCGSITVDEKYHSALDYDQYVNAKIWLPFCGFFDISSDLFMNNNLYLKYTIDVLTGKCVASLSTGKLDDANTVVYNFCGNAMMKIPYYVNNDEQRTNGAINNGVYNMSEKTPYVIITRQISVTPDSSQLDGKPASEYVRLGDLTGFTKCKEVTVNEMISTKAEKAEIESLLKKGVIL